MWERDDQNPFNRMESFYAVKVCTFILTGLFYNSVEIEVNMQKTDGNANITCLYT